MKQRHISSRAYCSLESRGTKCSSVEKQITEESGIHPAWPYWMQWRCRKGKWTTSLVRSGFCANSPEFSQCKLHKHITHI